MISAYRKLARRYSLPAAGALLAVGFFMAAGLAQADVAVAAVPATGPGAEAIQQGRTLFAQAGCAACHRLKDANATGVSGPALDGNAGLNRDLVIERVTYGQLDMPGFAGLLTDEEIAAIATYVVAASAT